MTFNPRAVVARVALLAGLAVVTAAPGGDGCGSSAPGGSGGGGGTGPVTTTGGSGGVGAGEPTCSVPLVGGDELPIDFQSLSASIVDPLQVGVEGVPVQVCGTDVCTTSVQSAADGSVLLDIEPEPFNRPLALWGDGRYWSLLAAPLAKPVETRSFVAVSLQDSLQALVAPSVIEASGVRLTVPTASQLSIGGSPADASTAPTLRVAVTTGSTTELIAPGLQFEAIVHLGPAPLPLCDFNGGEPIALDAAFAHDMPPGAPVELLQQELMAEEPRGTYGDWVVVAMGEAYRGGVRTSPGSGLRVISPVAVRRADQ